MIPKIVEIGPLTFHLYGAIIAFAIFVGWYLSKKRAGAYKIPKEIFEDPILLIPLILGVFGARLYHVLDYWDIYKQDPLSAFGISAGGLGILGGLAGALIGFWVVAKVKRINLYTILDLIAPPLILSQAIGRLGNWVNQEAFGPPTNLPWGIYISPQDRPEQFLQQTHFHPAFFYEAAIDAIFFLVLINLSKRLKKPGQVFATYLILYSTGRFIVEFFRIDTATVGDLKLAHIFSILIFTSGMILLKIRNLRS